MSGLILVYGYIYKIVNLVNGKLYVGQTMKPTERRFVEHKTKTSPSMRGRCTKLYNAILFYGKQNFKIELLDTASTRKELNLKEELYIKILNTVDNGYNLTWGGYNGPMSEEARKKISATSTGRKHSEAVKAKLSASHKNVKKSESHREAIAVITRKRFYAKNPFLENYEKIKTPVLQLDSDFNILHRFSSMKEAELGTSIPRSNISTSCRFGVPKAGGYFWIYDDDHVQESIEKKKSYKYRAVKVIQYDLNCEYVNSYNTIADAAKETGVTYDKIHRNIKNVTKTADNFIFRAA